MDATAHRNRLADEPSPYLKQHANNPVDWLPWGAEALERAKREDRPILLSIGYSACHWCHVMAHESFEDEATAASMNRHFVNIKVDREERPDVDQLYQGVVQLMGRGGGWPLTVFLTPDLRPFYGGTYFPPVPRHGLPGFGSLVEGLAEAWQKARTEVEEQADTFKQGLTTLARYGLDAEAAPALAADDIAQAARSLARQVDPRFGGFGHQGPKFPNPMNVALLLRGHRRTGEAAVLDAALLTLTRMAQGGVFDQLGGGFHRYAVDERWLVPHFEKMLSDNAQLLHLYAEAMQVAPRPLWRHVAESTVGWLTREMTSPDGAFFAAQDADSEGEEGKFFVWRPEELEAALGKDDAALLAAHLGVTEGGNFEHGTTVLEVVQDAQALAKAGGLSLDEVERRLAAARAKLLEVRARRIAPGRDDKVLAGWNGLMVRGLAFAGRVFGRPDWVALAARAADFLLLKLRAPDGGLFRSFQDGTPRLTGMLEDAGNVAAGLVALYQATFQPKYLLAAEALADDAVARFWDDDAQAYLAAPRGQADLLVPPFALHDNAFPSGASSLTEAHVGLAALTGRARHLEQAQRYLTRLAGELRSMPMAFGHLWLAADAAADGATEVTVVGAPQAAATLRAAVDATYLPTVHLHVVAPGQPVPPGLEQVLGERPVPAVGAAAYVCRAFSCQAPVQTADALLEVLAVPKVG